MKTKLMVLALMAGGSMFAATRFSVGVNVGGYAPACTTPVYNGYVAPAAPGYAVGVDRFGDHRDFDRDRGHDRDIRWKDHDDHRANDFRRR